MYLKLKLGLSKVRCYEFPQPCDGLPSEQSPPFLSGR
jgi:hypothetical protein